MDVTTIYLAGRIDQVIRDYFEKHPDVKTVKAKEMMSLLIEKGIFKKDHREGLPLRNVLRTLDKENQLSLLYHCYAERKEVNTNWYFISQP
jgi:hypothetical protein